MHKIIKASPIVLALRISSMNCQFVCVKRKVNFFIQIIPEFNEMKK